MLKPSAIFACISLVVGGAFGLTMLRKASEARHRQRVASVGAASPTGKAATASRRGKHQRKSRRGAPSGQSAPSKVSLEDNGAAFVMLQQLCDSGDEASCERISADSPDEGASTGETKRAPASTAPPRQLADDYIDPGKVSVALSFAKANGACERGEKGYCRRLDANGFEGRKLLKTMKQSLKQACDLSHMEACMHRAEIDFAETSLDSSRAWYAKSKKIASAQKARCDARREPNPQVCVRAEDVLAKVQTREEEISTRLRATTH